MNQSEYKKYIEHDVFLKLSQYSSFYENLSNSIIGWVNLGLGYTINIDTHVYSSMKNTIDSIRDILQEGKINDSYALLRKYYDSTIINVYSNLYLEDKFTVKDFIVKHIDDWIRGKEKIPGYRVVSRYVKESPKLQPLTLLFQQDKTYKDIRARCNDHVHYNYFQNLLINDSRVYFDNRYDMLSGFSEDLSAIFIQHISYVFYLNEHYMMSSDYVDALDSGNIPEDGSQYWVAPFVQEIFDGIIKPIRPDVAEIIKCKVAMNLS